MNQQLLLYSDGSSRCFLNSIVGENADLKQTVTGQTSSLGTGGMMGGLGLRSVRYMALESSSSDGGTFSFRCRSSH